MQILPEARLTASNKSKRLRVAPELSIVLCVQEMHALYERVHRAEGAAKLDLPTHYPTAALVGCVTVVGCLQVLFGMLIA